MFSVRFFVLRPNEKEEQGDKHLNKKIIKIIIACSFVFIIILASLFISIKKEDFIGEADKEGIRIEDNMEYDSDAEEISENENQTDSSSKENSANGLKGDALPDDEFEEEDGKTQEEEQQPEDTTKSDDGTVEEDDTSEDLKDDVSLDDTF